MTEEITITATEASRAFSDVLHRVCYGGESFVIKKGNRLMARLTPVGAKQQAEAHIAAPVAEEIEPEIVPTDMPIDEAEFYHAWLEQVRKVEG